MEVGGRRGKVRERKEKMETMEGREEQGEGKVYKRRMKGARGKKRCV